MRHELSETLRDAHRLLQKLDGGASRPALRRALDRLERDLLPRTAGADPHLVIGIVGPNNSGKSALFNALVGRPLSPSLATGGATRRLVGATHPQLLGRLRAEPTLSRFPIRELAGGAPAAAATEPAADPAELLVAAVAELPESVLLIDTPDFDSIFTSNRLASESLLAVSDLALAVVTRHSYQNREVVQFLQRWLAHGRPWMLFYNESINAEVVAAHAGKLAEDVGSRPVAVFHAPHDLRVPRDGALLRPQRLGGSEATPDLLRESLFRREEMSALKEQALASSLAQLLDDLEQVAHGLEGDAERAQEALESAQAAAADAAERVASASQQAPGDPFLEALKAELDARHALGAPHRRWMRKLLLGLRGLPARLRPKERAAATVQPDPVSILEARKLQDEVWAGYWERLARDFGPESRHAAKAVLPPALRAALEADLDPARMAAAGEQARQELARTPLELDAYRSRCRALIARSLDERASNLDLQVLTDLQVLLPVASGVAILATGGLGTDLIVGGGGVLGSRLATLLSSALGARVRQKAYRLWVEDRAGRIAPLLLDTALPEGGTRLRELAARDAATAQSLRRVCQEIA